MDVRFLIEDAKLVIAIDELDTRDVSILAGLFVLLTKTLHITLQRDDYHVQFLDLVGVLVDLLLLLLFLEIILV